MTIFKSYLCVGGPIAGQKYNAGGHNHFKVPVRNKTKNMLDPTNEPMEPTSIENVIYKEETFHTRQGIITFWIPSDQTWYETMKLLLEGYKPT